MMALANMWAPIMNLELCNRAEGRKKTAQWHLNAKRSSLGIIVLSLAAYLPAAHAIGLGAVQVHSTFLGQPLFLSIPLHGYQPSQEPPCIKAYVASLDGAMIAAARTQLVGSDEQKAIEVRTREGITEPAFKVSVVFGCDLPFQRDYQILLNFPAASHGEPLLPYLAQDEKPGKAARNAASASKAADFAPVPLSSRQAARRTVLTPPSGDSSAAKLAGSASEHHHHARHAREKRAPHSVLRLSAVTDAVVDNDAPVILRLSDTLTLPETGMLPAGDRGAGQERVATVASGSDDGRAARAKPDLPASGHEAQSGKNDGKSIKEPLPYAHNTLVNWIIGLGATVVLCLLAIAWMGWRMAASPGGERNASARKAWRRRFRKGAGGWLEEEERGGDAKRSGLLFETEPRGGETEPGAASQEDASGVARLHTLFAKHVDGQQDEAETSGEGAKHRNFTPNTALRSGEVKPRAASQEDAADVADHRTPFTKAEEVSDLLELAEAWFALNRPDVVIEILEPMSQEEPPKSPLQWIYLMNAYGLVGNEKNYDDLYHRIRNTFNVNVPDWNARSQSKPETRKTLEDFPHIKNRIVELWDSDEIVPYLERHLLDDRDGTRAGFPLVVYQNILKLINLAKDPARGKLSEDQIPDQLFEIIFPPGSIGARESEGGISFDLRAAPPFQRKASGNFSLVDFEESTEFK